MKKRGRSGTAKGKKRRQRRRDERGQGVVTVPGLERSLDLHPYLYSTFFSGGGEPIAEGQLSNTALQYWPNSPNTNAKESASIEEFGQT